METAEHLTPRYMQIMDLVMAGLKTGQVASKLKLTVPYVSTIINAPNFQSSLAIRRAQFEEKHDDRLAASNIESAEEVLRNAAKDAAERVVLEIDNTNATTALKAAAEVLDRVGPVKRSGGEATNQTVVIIDAKMANIINESLEMDG